MIAITLPDGSVKQLEEGVTPMDVALSISEGLARNVISAAYNGQTVESSTAWCPPRGKGHMQPHQS